MVDPNSQDLSLLIYFIFTDGLVKLHLTVEAYCIVYMGDAHKDPQFRPPSRDTDLQREFVYQTETWSSMYYGCTQ